jgi:Zn-dependent M28 family amino/carboxypeptidase
MAARLIAVAVAVALLAGCKAKPPPPIVWDAFSGDRAYEHVRQLVNYGPHPSGSPGLTRAATYITTQLQEIGLETSEQVFVAPTPRGPVQFRNIIGKTRGGHDGPEKVVVIASHYDTKWFTNMTFVGANDGGSSTGVLLEMARVASAQPNLWFVFLDGEEAMNQYGTDDGLWGSKFFVEDLKSRSQTDWIKAMVLLDMVGDSHLEIQIPADSKPSLIDEVFKAAKDTGHRDSFRYSGTYMLDDHVPFLNAGIPATDLIDFEFGSAPGLNDYWHTDKDTLDKISPHSLEITGQTTLRLLTLLQQVPSLR